MNDKCIYYYYLLLLGITFVMILLFVIVFLMVDGVYAIAPTNDVICTWGRWSSWLSRNTCSPSEWNNIHTWKSNGDGILDFIDSYNTFYNTHTTAIQCPEIYANNTIWGPNWKSFLDVYNLTIFENLTKMTFQCVANLDVGNDCSGIAVYIVPTCTSEVTTIITECATTLATGKDCRTLINGTTRTLWGHREFCNEPFCGVSGFYTVHWYDENESGLQLNHTGCIGGAANVSICYC